MMSSEPGNETARVTDDSRLATIKVGDQISRAPVADVEAAMVRINQHLQSRIGYGWMFIGDVGPDGEIPTTVLVSRSTPISITWPTGFEPFENPNKLVDEVRENPVADLPDDE